MPQSIDLSKSNLFWSALQMPKFSFGKLVLTVQNQNLKSVGV